MNYIWKVFLFLVVLLVCLTTSGTGLRTQEFSTPSVKQAVFPPYPPLAYAAGLSGEVVVDLDINTEGIVSNSKASTGQRILQSVVEAVSKKWTFNKDDGVKERHIKLYFKFKLMPDDTSSEDLLPIYRPPYEVEIKDKLGRIQQTINSDPPLRKKASGKKSHS